MTADRDAVAVWLPRDRPLPEIPDYERRLWLARGEYTGRFHELDAAFDKHHPSEATTTWRCWPSNRPASAAG